MAILHVRKVPLKLYERLCQQARSQHRSLSAEAITILQDALDKPRRTPNAILASVRQRRYFQPEQVAAPDSTTRLRQDRAR